MSETFEGNFLISEEEIDFLLNQEFMEEYPNILESMNEPRFTISDLKIAPRDATYWDKQGILPIVKGPGMRRKYDLPQSLWIKLIQQMRSLGIGLPTIKKLKDHLLEPKLNVEELLRNDAIKQIFKKMLEKDKEHINVDELLADPIFLSEIKGEPMTVFEIAVLSVVVYRKPLNYIVNKDGEYLLYSANKHTELINKAPEISEFITSPHFCLSITKAYASLVQEWSPEPFISKISLLSKSELEILDIIRRKDVNSITIKYKDGEPDLLEIETQNEISMEQRFLDVIAKNGYQKISVSTQNGKIVHFENKIQMKLNKRTK